MGSSNCVVQESAKGREEGNVPVEAMLSGESAQNLGEIGSPAWTISATG